MKIRSMLFTAVVHAGLIALSWMIAGSATPVIEPGVPATMMRAGLAESPNEIQRDNLTPEYRLPSQARTASQPDTNPIEFDVSDVIPEPEPRPEPQPPEPVLTKEDSLDNPRTTDETFEFHRPAQPEPEATAKEIVDPSGSANSPATSTVSAAPTPHIVIPPIMADWEAPEDVRRGFEGRIVAIIELDAEGELVSIRLDPGTGDGEWDRQLRNSFRRATYRPAVIDGKPSPGTLRQPVDFE